MQGGLGDFSRELARALAAAHHSVHILTLASAMDIDAHRITASEAGVHVHRIVPGWGWSTLSHVSRFAREHAIDVIDLQYQAAAYQMHGAINLLPRQLRKLPATKTFVTFHDLRVPYLFPKAGPLRWLAILQMARGAHGVIVTNVEDEATLLRHQVKSAVIPIGSNISNHPLPGFVKSDWLASFGVTPGTPVIGYFGFMNESKGADVLVQALAKLRSRQTPAPVVLFIGAPLGDSDLTNVAYRNHVNGLIDKLGVRPSIFQTGYLDEVGVSRAFAACDCVALPYRDGVSFRRGTLMAALSHACAIVTTLPRVAIPQIKDGLNMLLTPVDDPDALAQAISRLLADPVLTDKLRTGARELSSEFQWPAIARNTVVTFNS